MKTVYLDNAATTPLRQEVISEMMTVLESDFGNPSSTHSYGRKARSHIELARKQIASLIGASPNEIIFTSGGTEADNLVIQSSCDSLGVNRIISSEIERASIQSRISIGRSLLEGVIRLRTDCALSSPSALFRTLRI